MMKNELIFEGKTFIKNPIFKDKENLKSTL